jgi:K+-sensing histidine kinase KdpD
MVVTVQADDAMAAEVARYRALSIQLGSSFAVLGGSDVAASVIQAARESMVEHVVVGEMASESVVSRFRPGIVDQVIDRLPSSDIHVIARLAK